LRHAAPRRRRRRGGRRHAHLPATTSVQGATDFGVCDPLPAIRPGGGCLEALVRRLGPRL
jgi:hypothetical protein